MFRPVAALLAAPAKAARAVVACLGSSRAAGRRSAQLQVLGPLDGALQVREGARTPWLVAWGLRV